MKTVLLIFALLFLSCTESPIYKGDTGSPTVKKAGAIDYNQRIWFDHIRIDTANHKISIINPSRSCNQAGTIDAVFDTLPMGYIISADTLYLFSIGENVRSNVYIGNGNSLEGTWEMQSYKCDIPQLFSEIPADTSWHSFQCPHSSLDVEEINSEFDNYYNYQVLLSSDSIFHKSYFDDYCFSDWVLNEIKQNEVRENIIENARWIPRDSNCQIIDVTFPDSTKGIYWQEVYSEVHSARFFEYQGKTCQYSLFPPPSMDSLYCYRLIFDSTMIDTLYSQRDFWFQCIMDLGVVDKGYLPLW